MLLRPLQSVHSHCQVLPYQSLESACQQLQLLFQLFTSQMFYAHQQQVPQLKLFAL